MSVDSLSSCLSNIRFLIGTLTKKNFKAYSEQLFELVHIYGIDADRYFLRSLLSNIDISEPINKISCPSVYVQLFQLFCDVLIKKPSFVAIICNAFEFLLSNQTNSSVDQNFFPQITKSLRLTSVQEVAITSALRYSTLRADLSTLARTHLKTIVPALIESYIATSGHSTQHEGGLRETSAETLHFILTNFLKTPKEFGFSGETYVQFTRALQKDYSRDLVPVVVTPFIYQTDIQFERPMASNTTPSTGQSSAPNALTGAILSANGGGAAGGNGSGNVMNDNSKPQTVTELIFEFGYTFTSSAEMCRSGLLAFNCLNTSDVIKEELVAKVLIAMFRYDDAGLKDDESWNFELFVETVNEMNTAFCWRDTICYLDTNEFQVNGRKALQSLITIVTHTIRNHQVTLQDFFRPWNNFENQYRLLQTIIKNPDQIPLNDLQNHLVNIDGILTHTNLNSAENAIWRLVDFVKCLLVMSERGFYNEIKYIFKHALKSVPEILTLVLISLFSSVPSSLICDHLMPAIIYFLVTNSANSLVIFRTLWHSPNAELKKVFLRCLVDYYMKSEFDQTILAKILDLSQELSALSVFLKIQFSFAFLIDFACLASRRDFLNLDKFLNDKVQEFGEPFLNSLIDCLSRRTNIMSKVDDSGAQKNPQLMQDTVNVILNCVQKHATPLTRSTSSCLNNVEFDEGVLYGPKQQQQPQQPQPQQRQPLVVASTSNNTNVTNAAIAAFIRGQRPQPQPQLQPSVDAISFPQSLNVNSLFKNGGINFDPINSLSNLALNKFNMSGPLGQLVTSSTPGSPSRLMNMINTTTVSTTNTSFASSLLSIQQQQQQVTAAIGTSTQPFVPNMNSVSNLNRMSNNSALVVDKLPAPAIDKSFYSEANTVFSKEIDMEANSYFQRIYNHSTAARMSPDELLEILKNFQESKSKREFDIFSCMMKNLFEEYQFFPQYPEEELRTTAQLFGGLIDGNVVPDYIYLGLALRYVLDALKKPHGTPMYYFGITALDKFKSRLKDFPQYCETIRLIPNYSEFPHHLIEYVENGYQCIPPENRGQNSILPATSQSAPPLFKALTNPTTATSAHSTPSKSLTTITPSARPSIANATNIDTLLMATDKTDLMKDPPEAVQEKIAFIFNNLSQLNMQTKCEEIKDVLLEEYWPWFAQYLVMKRATIEFNFHFLYINFLDAVKINEINRLVTLETFRNIKVLLRSDKIVSNFSDRSLLKNLGHWLGMLTVARHKPILHIDIDFKSLLLEAFQLGQEELLFIVPFIAKVLEATGRSKIFKPPNPWTMTIMNMLAELHSDPATKLNLKFEVEVLCKSLQLDLLTMKPTNILKDSERFKIVNYQLHRPKKNEEIPLKLPKYNYFDTNLTMGNILVNLVINPSLVLIQSNPTLKGLVKTAFDIAAQEWFSVVCDRLTKIAVNTTEQTVRKDFALDPEESHMRVAAHHMVRNVTSGYVMIMCRDQLVSTTQRHLKDTFIKSLNLQSEDEKNNPLLAQTIDVLIQDNIDFVCATIQKVCVERGLVDIDKRLANDFELRIVAKNEGRRYQDPRMLAYQRDIMPEQLRVKSGPVTHQQQAIYEQFARNIPGFMPIADHEMELLLPKGVPFVDLQTPCPSATNMLTNSLMVSDEFLNVIDKLILDCEQYVQLFGNGSAAVTNFQSLSSFVLLVGRLRDALLKGKSLQSTFLSIDLIKITVESLQKGLMLATADSDISVTRFRDLHIRVLKALQDARGFGVQWVNKTITRWLIECPEDIRYCFEAVDSLIRAQLVNLSQYDLALAQFIENGNGTIIVMFAIQLLQSLLVDNKMAIINESDFFNIIEVLNRVLVHSRTPPDGLAMLMDAVLNNRDQTSIMAEKATSGALVHIHSGILQMRNNPDMSDIVPGLLEKTEGLLHEWISMYHNHQSNRDWPKMFQHFIQQMSLAGVLKTDDLITNFFRIATHLCVDAVYRLVLDQTINPAEVRSKTAQTLDPFVRLIVLLVKHSGDNSNSNTKLHLFNKIVGLVAGCLLQDQEMRGHEFHQLPYHRIFLLLFIEMNSNEPVLENINFQVLITFCHILHIVRPSQASGFTYAWLHIISHRVFIGRMLAVTPNQKGWSFYAQLLIDLFKFLAPFIRNAEISKPIMTVYNGTMKLLLILLHDFPEFLCDYHYGFCDVIPPNCIQMRNLILSSFPHSMRLADPFVASLRIDQLPEISVAPRILTNYETLIKPANFKRDLDSYLDKRTPVTFLSELRSHLQANNEPGSRYNIPLLNALVVYVGVQAIECIRKRNLTTSTQTISCSAHMDIYQNLLVDLDNEGRYLFLNAISNQLRFPNSHTHYFSCVILKLYAEANSPKVQEQITRILLERLIVNRPHPWGLLITFIELIKNPIYKFWTREFVNCAPEITNLLESVANSCMVQKQQIQKTDSMP